MSKRTHGETPGLIELLQKAIQESGKSLDELEKRAGIGSGSLSRFMRGARMISLPSAEKVCRALGLRVALEAPRRKPGQDRGGAE
jgi:transcriptional regulator with XRE-family HTH domain